MAIQVLTNRKKMKRRIKARTIKTRKRNKISMTMQTMLQKKKQQNSREMNKQNKPE